MPRGEDLRLGAVLEVMGVRVLEGKICSSIMSKRRSSRNLQETRAAEEPQRVDRKWKQLTGFRMKFRVREVLSERRGWGSNCDSSQEKQA